MKTRSVERSTARPARHSTALESPQFATTRHDDVTEHSTCGAFEKTIK